MAKASEVVRKVMSMIDAGRLPSSVLDRALDGLEITTPRGTGVYVNGMLDLGDRKVTLNISNISTVVPKVIEVSAKDPAPSSSGLGA